MQQVQVLYTLPSEIGIAYCPSHIRLGCPVMLTERLPARQCTAEGVEYTCRIHRPCRSSLDTLPTFWAFSSLACMLPPCLASLLLGRSCSMYRDVQAEPVRRWLHRRKSASLLRALRRQLVTVQLCSKHTVQRLQASRVKGRVDSGGSTTGSRVAA